jgi:hypothetical protein
MLPALRTGSENSRGKSQDFCASALVDRNDERSFDILSNVEYSEHDKLGCPRLVVENDVLLYEETPTTGKEAVPRLASFRIISQPPECFRNGRSVN